jgi:AcrR family transcriptional regulator
MNQRKIKEQEFRRDLIIVAARKVFSQKGFITATIDDISKSAEIARATLYKFFPAKEDIYNAVVENVFAEIYNLAETSMKEPLPVKDKFELFTDRLLSHFQENADFFSVLIQQMHKSATKGAGKKHLDDRHQKLEDILVKEIEAGIRAGQIRDIDPQLAVRLFNQIVYGYQMSYIHKTHGASERLQIVQSISDIFFNGITKREDHP